MTCTGRVGGLDPSSRARQCLACLADIDKVMINLKTEEFVLEMTTLQSLQQLIQWVGDFVLYLLASLPNQVSGGHAERTQTPVGSAGELWPRHTQGCVSLSAQALGRSREQQN